MLSEAPALPSSWTLCWGLLSEEQLRMPPVMLFANAEMEEVERNMSPDGGIEPVDLKAVMLKLINFSLAIRVILILIMEWACW